MDTQTQEVIREDRGRVRILSLNRPPANTLNMSLLHALRSEIEAAGKDEGVRCVVLSSTSPKYFSAGLDLDEMLAGAEQDASRLFRAMIEAHRLLAGLGKPTVAAVSGSAFLGGFILTLGCDWRFLSENGRVALSEVRLGLSPTTSLVRLVLGLTGKPALVKELVLQGRNLRAAEALEAGLVDYVLPAEGFLESVVKEADKMTKLAPRGYAAVQRAVRAALLPDEEALWKDSHRELEVLLAGEEAREGLQAMKEKRKPRWE